MKAKVYDDLDIRNLPSLTSSEAIPPRYSPFSIVRLPAFWLGAIEARADSGPGMDNLYRLHALAETEGVDIVETLEFRRWLGYERKEVK